MGFFLPCLVEISAAGSSAGSPGIQSSAESGGIACCFWAEQRGGNICTLLRVHGDPLHGWGGEMSSLSTVARTETRLGLRGGRGWGAGEACKADRWLHSQPRYYRNKLGKSQAKQLLSLR